MIEYTKKECINFGIFCGCLGMIIGATIMSCVALHVINKYGVVIS